MGRPLLHKVLGAPKYDLSEVGAEKYAHLYEMWHAKEPDGAHLVEYTFPTNLVCIGTAEAIVYHSDKKERDGDGFDYEHMFDTTPEVYAPAGNPFFAPMGRPVPTQKILRSDPNDKVVLAAFGVVNELEINVGDNEALRMHFRNHEPLLCMTTDKTGLIIFATMQGQQVPLFIRGGKMHVTSHGIEK